MEELWPAILEAFKNKEWSAGTILLTALGIFWLCLKLIKDILETIISGREAFKPEETVKTDKGKRVIQMPTPAESRAYGRQFTSFVILAILVGIGYTAAMSTVQLSRSNQEKIKLASEFGSEKEARVAAQRAQKAEIAQLQMSLASSRAFEQRYEGLLAGLDSAITRLTQSKIPAVMLADVGSKTNLYLRQIEPRPGDFELHGTEKTNDFRRYLELVSAVVREMQRGPLASPGEIEDLKAIRAAMAEAIAEQKRLRGEKK
jgi:hypothetical protein